MSAQEPGITRFVSERSWQFCEYKCPRSQIVFVVQVLFVVLFSAICAANIVLSETCEESTPWIAFLTSLIGYMLPAPRP